MPKKKKHPMHLTDDEVLNHLFHKDIAKAVRKHLKDNSAAEPKKTGKPQVIREKKPQSQKGL
jgi:hypothetical protein